MGAIGDILSSSGERERVASHKRGDTNGADPTIKETYFPEHKQGMVPGAYQDSESDRAAKEPGPHFCMLPGYTSSFDEIEQGLEKTLKRVSLPLHGRTP
uniref:Uncharacterized protein n=1 Tax=Thermosporothrix sp. COM3 TaxID=2490863 RepID=A0A455SKB1_9CHLR|nr:hypothetical protein KTC_21030 [Thermosporothrix sp. COM3]